MFPVFSFPIFLSSSSADGICIFFTSCFSFYISSSRRQEDFITWCRESRCQDDSWESLSRTESILSRALVQASIMSWMVMIRDDGRHELVYPLFSVCLQILPLFLCFYIFYCVYVLRCSWGDGHDVTTESPDWPWWSGNPLTNHSRFINWNTYWRRFRWTIKLHS